MALANSANVAIAYVAETTWGTTPAAPAMKELRAVSENIEFKKSALVSQELKSHRQIANAVHGSHTVDGTIDCEFSDALDDWLEAGMFGVITGGVLKLGQTVKSFSVERRMTNVGWNQQYKGVRVNGLQLDLKPDSIAQIKFPVMGRTMPTPTADALGSPTGWLVNNVAGYPVDSVTMLINTGTPNFAADDQFVIYNAASAVLQRSDQIYTVSSADATNVTFTPGLDVAILDNDILHAVTPATVVSAADPMNAFSGAITEGGSAIAICTSITVNIDQGIEAASVIGSNLYAGLVPGPVKVSGQLDLYVLNTLLYNKFVTEGYSTLQFDLTDGVATYSWLLPRIKYTGASVGKGSDGKTMQIAMPFEAVYDGTDETAVKLTIS